MCDETLTSDYFHSVSWLALTSKGKIMKRPNLRNTVLVGGALAFCAMGASAETLRWASTTDPQTMDPHAVNSAPVLSFLNN
ncbi:MAG: hypothetical protein ACJAUW_001739, partial [Yoonia sp.]